MQSNFFVQTIKHILFYFSFECSKDHTIYTIKLHFVLPTAIFAVRKLFIAELLKAQNASLLIIYCTYS